MLTHSVSIFFIESFSHQDAPTFQIMDEDYWARDTSECSSRKYIANIGIAVRSIRRKQDNKYIRSAEVSVGYSRLGLLFRCIKNE